MLGNFFSQGREAVLHEGRHYRIGHAQDKAIVCESLEALGKHFLADATDFAPQLTEPMLALAKG